MTETKVKAKCPTHLCEMVQRFSGKQNPETGEWEKRFYCPVEYGEPCQTSEGIFARHNFESKYEVHFWSKSWEHMTCTRCGFKKSEEMTGGY